MANEGRITHITRIYQNDDPDSGTWIDVERIDQLTVIVAGRQRRTYQFDWDAIESGVADDHKTIADPHDPDNTIDLPIRNAIRLQFPRAVYNHYFINDGTNQSRETHSRRIYHHEIKEDYLRDGEPPRDPETYLDSLGQQDPDQFIDVELLDAYWTSGDDANDLYQHYQGLQAGMAKGPKTVRDQIHQWVGTTNDPLLQDPLKADDVAGGEPGFMLEINPEAGIVDPPWRLDPLQNIVNVQWAITVRFISGALNQTGDAADLLRYAEVHNRSEPEWTSAGDGAFAGGAFEHGGEVAGFAAGAIGADMVFVAVGARSRGTTKSQGIIMASTDGIEWQQVFEGKNPDGDPISVGSNVWAVTFDGNRFWAAAHESENGIDISEVNEIDILLSSSDGFSWEESGRNKINFVSWESYDSNEGLLTPHLSTKFSDPNGNGVPSGIWGEDINSGLALAPDPIPWSPDFLFGGTGYRDLPTKVSGPEPDTGGDPPPSAELPIPCSCVAFAGGVWMAGGGDTQGAKSAYSFDGGKTWTASEVGGSSGFMSGIAGGRVKKSSD